MSAGNQDFAALKKLLISWNVEILYDLFKEEDIAIEELKMLKFRHLSHLLKNYKMGVRIRFEHHLENWRNKMGKPLEEQTSVMCNCHCKSSGTENRKILETERSNKKTLKRSRIANEMPTENIEQEYNEQPAPQSPQSTKSTSSYTELPVNFEMPNLTPITVLNTPGPQYNHRNWEQEEAVPETETLTTLTHLLAASLGDSPKDDTTPVKYTSKFAPDNHLPVSLAQILQLSGSRGMAIVKYYNEHKHLTNTHRTQLIQTIVEFFDDNDYHLSLNMSHNLEWQLLKMFPTEKIENYRTEKRGKIYVKFSNMKRYKRERNSRPSKADTDKSQNSSNQNVSGITDNMDTTSYDAWAEGAGEAQIEIKPEVLSDDDNNLT